MCVHEVPPGVCGVVLYVSVKQSLNNSVHVQLNCVSTNHPPPSSLSSLNGTSYLCVVCREMFC